MHSVGDWTLDPDPWAPCNGREGDNEKDSLTPGVSSVDGAHTDRKSSVTHSPTHDVTRALR